MSEEHAADKIRLTVEVLIKVAEAEVSAEGGCAISPVARDILTCAVTRDLSVPFDQKGVTDADHIATIKTQMRMLADGVIAIVDGRPGNAVAPESGRTAETAEVERRKGLQILSDALDGQRNRAEDLWNAATAKTSWVPGRDADRRINAMRHEPERRRP